MNEKTYNWEIGKTYKTRDGLDAKFIAYVPEAAERSRLVFLVGDQVRTYYEDGKFLSKETELDILPPKRTVYVPILKSSNGRVYAATNACESDDEARGHGARIHMNLGWKLLAIASVEIDA